MASNPFRVGTPFRCETLQVCPQACYDGITLILAPLDFCSNAVEAR